MLVGIPKEVKNLEFRVGATPEMVKALVDAGHKVKIQADAGEKIGFTNERYQQMGASIVETAEEAYDSEMVIKVKEPQKSEYAYLKEGQVLFCYLHLAPDPELTAALLEKKIVGIAYETVTNKMGGLPLLIPMSEIAGRFAVQAGALALQISSGGKGLLMGGIPGVPPAKVVILGGGTSGTQAARVAVGLGADVTLLDVNLHRMHQLDEMFGTAVKTIYSTSLAIEDNVRQADLVIGAVLIPGKRAPMLVSRELVRQMGQGSVIADVSIDQGACVETARATTHSDPTYIEEGVVHYCVTNIPGACSRTSTQALTHATLPYVMRLANLGYRRALETDSGLMEGLNVWHGQVTNEHVADDLGYSYRPAREVLESMCVG